MSPRFSMRWTAAAWAGGSTGTLPRWPNRSPAGRSLRTNCMTTPRRSTIGLRSWSAMAETERFSIASRMLGGRPVPIIGINSGRLGFLANVSKRHLETAFRDLREGNYSVVSRTLIRAEGDFGSSPEYPFAFNELAIQRQSPNMISTTVFVNDEMIATYWGDGVLVSTPAGSTAYSLSVGGPVVAPDCRCFLISPIAPHNLTMRPSSFPIRPSSESAWQRGVPISPSRSTIRPIRPRTGLPFASSRPISRFFWSAFKIYRSTIR